MKLVFVSNFFNHHQKPISDYFDQKLEQYTFVSTTQLPEERKALGYSAGCEAYERPFDSEDVPTRIDAADVCICASTDDFGKKIIASKKNVFYYSERIEKRPSIIKRIPRCVKLHRLLRNESMLLLAAGAFVSNDYSKYGLFRDKAYKWGYFPETRQYDRDTLIAGKDNAHILWCGRYIDWKHPDDALMVAKKLKADGYRFRMTLIGAGAMEDQLKSILEEYRLSDCVEILGSMSPEAVRSQMEHAGIYLFTSDRQEGWGAVLNESMNSGCAVVAAHAIGAVPYLMENNVNGIVYRFGDMDSLYCKVKYLLENPQEQGRLGSAAYDTIRTTWNAEIAAERFVMLAERVLAGEKNPQLFESGPCSRAGIIEDDWFAE